MKKYLFVVLISLFSFAATAAELTVYKSPDCGCCDKWSEIMENAGFDVTVHNISYHEIADLKTKLRVPRNLQSCHTATVDGYVIEGHVPAKEIFRLLQERPEIQGIAVPGMPPGSPGMESPQPVNYRVISFSVNGDLAEYAYYAKGDSN